ncbi:hypothetical protein D3C80_1710950 [compost metagenome]
MASISALVASVARLRIDLPPDFAKNAKSTTASAVPVVSNHPCAASNFGDTYSPFFKSSSFIELTVICPIPHATFRTANKYRDDPPVGMAVSNAIKPNAKFTYESFFCGLIRNCSMKYLE